MGLAVDRFGSQFVLYQLFSASGGVFFVFRGLRWIFIFLGINHALMHSLKFIYVSNPFNSSLQPINLTAWNILNSVKARDVGLGFKCNN